MRWFDGIRTLDELRKTFKLLVIKYHPDNGFSDDTIKSINAEYDIMFRKFKDGYEHSEAYDTKTDRQKQSYDWKKDKQIREIIIQVCKLSDIVVVICGVWIWLSGDTK